MIFELSGNTYAAALNLTESNDSSIEKHWVDAEIATLKSNGVIDGSEHLTEITSELDEFSTRAAAVALLLRSISDLTELGSMLDQVKYEETAFNDIAGHWVENYIKLMELSNPIMKLRVQNMPK